MKPSKVKNFEYRLVRIVYRKAGAVEPLQFIGTIIECLSTYFYIINSQEKKRVYYSEVKLIELFNAGWKI